MKIDFQHHTPEGFECVPHVKITEETRAKRIALLHMKSRFFAICLAMLCLLAGFHSCQDLEDIYDRLDKVETEVDQLQSAIAALQEAYNQSKYIKSVTPLTDDENGGWLVQFSDLTSIRIENGGKGEQGEKGEKGEKGDTGYTPFLKIDQEGRWAVSYDGGKTFVQLLDSEGSTVMATGPQGEEGISVRLVVGEEGYYVFQYYHSSAPDVVIDETMTSYVADAGQAIASLTQDEKNHTFTIVLMDGSSFTFNLQHVVPTSIALLSTNALRLSSGTQASIEFRVNPSNALVDFSGEGNQIVLDKVGVAESSRSSYVTVPDNYRLVRVEQVYNGDTGEMKAGQYRAVIEDTRQGVGYDEWAALVINVQDEGGEQVQISSNAFGVKWQSFDIISLHHLPVVVINTPGSVPILSKEEYVTGATISLLNADMSLDFQGVMKIKGRGNSTWFAAKKPYKIKFDVKQSLFGAPKDKEWVLLSNYYDKSLIRTDVAFWMAARYGGFEYVPRFCTADLMLNGEYKGTYQLGDQPKIGENRVNAGNDGFLLEIDAKAEATDVTFHVNHIGQPINFKDPNVAVGDEGYNYVVDYVSRADAALFGQDWLDEKEGYKTLIDINSFVEWYLVNEMTKNGDASFFTSCYMNLSRHGKLKMGPLWDFDVSLGGYPPSWSNISDFINQTDGFHIKAVPWINRMFKDPEFVRAVKKRYDVYYAHKQEILNYIDATANKGRLSAMANNRLWGTLCPKECTEAEFEAAYTAEIEYLKRWLSARMDWLKKEYDAM